MSPDSNAEIASRFGEIAKRFCSIVDAADLDRFDFLFEIYRVLPKLVDEAINLPHLSLDEQDESEKVAEPEDGSKLRKKNGQNCKYELVKQRLGDWDVYMHVFDPTTDKDAIYGSLADDIADIYQDLREGLDLSQAQAAEAIWTWRFHYYFHWGRHALDALRTIHFRLESGIS
jgi:Domain of unknown function (DUF5063)